jgi:hypothetical protein
METTMTAHRRISRLRSVGLAAAALLAAFALGACGAGSSSSSSGRSTATTAGKDAASIVAASADATSQAKSARTSMTIDASAGGRSFAFTADGAFDFAGRSGVMTMDMGSTGLPGVSGKIEIRIVDGVLYMDMGSLFAGLSPGGQGALGGKQWVKLDLTTVAGETGASGFGSLGSSDPTSILDSLRGAGADVQEVGHDVVRGVETTHYRGQIDLSQALAKLPAAERERAASALQSLGTGTVPADVWIDAQGRLRKLAMDYGAASGTAQLGKVTLELFDFGTEVDVQAPPADQVTDLQSMLGGALGGMLGSTGASGGVSS